MCAEEISPLTLLQVGVAVHKIAVVAGWLAIVSTGLDIFWPFLHKIGLENTL